MECHNKITQPNPRSKTRMKPLRTETILSQVIDSRKTSSSSPAEVTDPLQLTLK